MNIDVGLSVRLGEAVGAKLGDCYRSAFLALPMAGESAVYVEGYAILDLGEDSPWPLEHGWIEKEDGRVVDPTWSDGIGAEYFPALRFGHLELLSILGRGGMLPVFAQNYPLPKAMLLASASAWEFCGDLGASEWFERIAKEVAGE